MMITNAPPWPNGARCAVAFTFDLDADSILHLSHHASADTRIAQTSALRYGPEVALPRLLSIYREFGMRQTFFYQPGAWNDTRARSNKSWTMGTKLAIITTCTNMQIL